MPELPASAWERFLADGDGPALLAALGAIAERGPPRDVDYPEYHRLCDVELSGQPYRVCRLVDVDDGRERLFIQPTDTPDLERPGVPYSLRGAELVRWVRSEARSS